MYNVVLIDDEALFLEGFRKKIDWNSYGFTVSASFQNPCDALRYLMENPVELVVTDIRMPFMDGIAFIKELRGFMPDVPVIILSGFSDFEYAKEAIRYQVSNYLLKPVSTEELALTLIELKEKLDEKFDKKTSAGNSEGYYSKLVENIKRSVLRNFRTASLESVALEMKMSTNYVSKIFKKVSGQNFSDYLIEVKMTNARRLIEEGSFRIYEIAYMVGYDNPKNFTRAFRNYWGDSPRECRENGFRE